MAFTFGSTPVGNLGGEKNNNKKNNAAEAFRANEEKMLTSSGGTAGDDYYINEAGTGTGQGGSGNFSGAAEFGKKSTTTYVAPATGSVDWEKGATLKEDENISGNFLSTAIKNASVEELATLANQNTKMKEYLTWFKSLENNIFVMNNETGAGNVAKSSAALAMADTPTSFANTPVGNLAEGNTTESSSSADSETFRETEEKMLTSSGGTAGDNYYNNEFGTGTGQGGTGAGAGTTPAWKIAELQSGQTVTDDQKETFRETEENYLTNYSGTAGDNYYINEFGTGTGQGGTGAGAGTTPAWKIAELQAGQNVTDDQKETFRQNEENYLTNYSGTAGDDYYINEEGTGTGQGGDGLINGTVVDPNFHGDPAAPTNTTTTTTTTTTNGGNGGNNTVVVDDSAKSAKAGGGGSATDVEYIPDAPQTIEVPKKRRKFKGKRGLRLQANALNIPGGTGGGVGSGLNIPT